MYTTPEVDETTITDAELTGLLGGCARDRSGLDAFEARLLVELDRRDLARRENLVDAADWLAHHGAVPVGVAKARVAAAKALDGLPDVAAALAAGEVGEAHVSSITRAVAEVGADVVAAAQADLVRWARTSPSPEAFAKRLRRWILTVRTNDGVPRPDAERAERSLRLRTDNVEGVGHLHATLPAVDHAIVTTTLWNLVDEQWRAEHGAEAPLPPRIELTTANRLADALVEMARRAAGAGVEARNKALPLMIVTIDHDTLMGRLSEAGQAVLADGQPVPVAEARRRACEAGLLPVVLDGESIPLDLGRTQRLASVAQRNAMLARSLTCEWPGCQTPAAWCQAHHLTWWDNGGPTDLHNLAWACTKHHHAAHEGGWTMTRNPDGQIQVKPPPTNSTVSADDGQPPDSAESECNVSALGGRVPLGPRVDRPDPEPLPPDRHLVSV